MECFHADGDRRALSGVEAAERLGMKVAAIYVAKGRVQKMLQDEVKTLDLEETAE